MRVRSPTIFLQAFPGFVTVTEREVYRDPFRAEVFQCDTPPLLNDSQADAFARLTAALADRYRLEHELGAGG